MITEAILNLFFSLIIFLIGLLPSLNIPSHNVLGFFDTLSSVSSLLPDRYLYYLFGSVIFWKSTGFTWALIEWCYKKIPGVS